MSVVYVQADDALARLEVSRNRLRRAAPDLSAERLMRRRQWIVLAVIGVLGLIFLIVWPMATAIVFVALCTVVYFATVAHRVMVTVLSSRTDSVIMVSDEDARAMSDEDLPVYTVLVPTYHESEVIDRLLTNLGSLDYPAHKLDLKVLMEADDTDTVERALQHPLADRVDMVLVPAGEPRTKPKALNYGLTLARGELVTIYDAEDEPDTLQLRRAAVAFARSADDVACMQAQLTYRNPNQNLITRWFTIEYLMWFTLFLPGLSRVNAPIPLGGTSNHVRRSVLEGLGGWDPYNVTEDADLGVRLHRVGWRCAVLGSITYEEANSDFVNWMKQRSRWYKGYLQTWLVHLRHPVQLWRELGALGFLQFNLFIGGTPLMALLNPVFWGLTILWFLGKFSLIQALFPAPVYYAGLICWAVGNLAVLYITVLAARRSEKPSLVLAALFVPLYWIMMSLSAIKAGIQLIAQPNYWEKTTHGLDGPGGPAPVAAPGAGPATVVTTVVAEPMVADGGAPAIAVSDARSATTSVHLVRAARTMRTIGLLALGLVLWLLVGTALVARHDAGARLETATAPAHSLRPPADGDPIATVAIGDLHPFTVLEGTGQGSLDLGVGHAPSSVLPGGDGNAVLIGHRKLSDGPLDNLHAVSVGDQVKVDSRWGPSTYTVDKVQTLAADALSLAPTGAARLTVVTAAGPAGSYLQVRASLDSPPIARLPRSRVGYPALPGADLAALLAAGTWAVLGVMAWSAGRLLMRRWGHLGGLLAVIPLVIIVVLAAYVSVGHAFPGTT